MRKQKNRNSVEIKRRRPNDPLIKRMPPHGRRQQLYVINRAKHEWHLIKQTLTQLVLSSAVRIRRISIKWTCKIIAVIFSLTMAKRSNSSECLKFSDTSDDLAVAAALANDVALPAVSLRSLSHTVEFRKGIGLKLFLFVLNFSCYALWWHNKPTFYLCTPQPPRPHRITDDGLE